MLILLLAVTALVLGSHVTLPLELARLGGGAEELARRWALLAAPSLAAAALLALVVLRSLGLDGMAGAPLPDEGWLYTRARLAGVLLAGLLLSDLVVLFAWSRFVRPAWALAAGLGVLVLVGICAVAVSVDSLRPRTLEPVRAEVEDDRWIESSRLTTDGPTRTLTRIGALSLLALAAGGIPIAHRWSRRARRLLALVGAVGALLLLVAVRPEVRPLLVAGRDHWSVAASATLFALTGWLGPRLATLCRLLALLIACAVVARLLALGG